MMEPSSSEDEEEGEHVRFGQSLSSFSKTGTPNHQRADSLRTPAHQSTSSSLPNRENPVSSRSGSLSPGLNSANAFGASIRRHTTNEDLMKSYPPLRLPPPPSPLRELTEEELLEKKQRDEEERKKKLQLYVFVSKCIAYPFNTKQPTDLVRRPQRVTRPQLDQLQARFLSFLKGETQIMADEAFQNVVHCYYELFLCSDRVFRLVESGGCCQNDFREVFRNNIEKRIRALPEIDGLNKETVITSWMAKFDCIFKSDDDPKKPPKPQPNLNTELVLTREQLYDMFQQILSVKKFEHQLLFNVLQLDSSDEQAAAIRRELDGRMQNVLEMEKNRKLMPKLVLKEMERMYVDETKAQINTLMANLESLPVSKGDIKYSLPKLKRYNPRSTWSLSKFDSENADNEIHLTKSDVSLSFQIEIVVMEVKGLKTLQPNRIVYCTMELEGLEKFQTDAAEASKPLWDTQADFTTTQPLPVLKIKLLTENPGILSLEDKELGRLVIIPTTITSRNAEWYTMTPHKNSSDHDLRIKIICRIEKPLTMKHSGYLYAIGKLAWKKWKRRYFVLVQVSQYTFAMCSYKQKKSEPSEMMQLDGYTVDYIEGNNAQLMVGQDLEGGRFYFNAVKAGDTMVLACDDENEYHFWVMVLYRATGQALRPTPLTTNTPKTVGLCKTQLDTDRARKHGMEEYISADPCKFDHNELFKMLLKFTLDYRLKDPYCSMGWLSPGQMFVLDEYCARYGIRTSYRHLQYMNALLERTERGTMVDPHLLHFSYAYCVNFVNGNKPNGVSTITIEERDLFAKSRERLTCTLEHDITHFRYSYPFGRPEGALKAAISLLERVLMKDDSASPSNNKEFRDFLKRCLEKAALINYSALTNEVNQEDDPRPDMAIHNKHLDDLIHLAELCIDQVQQNEEHYGESFRGAFSWFSDLLVEHTEIFWALFAIDMDRVVNEQPPDTWDAFPLFQLLNDYLRMNDNLKNGRFHQHLSNLFGTLVIRYIDLMESSIIQSVMKGFEKEQWVAKGNGCATSEDLLWKLDALQSFINDLNWPDEQFKLEMDQRLKQMAFDMMESCINKIDYNFHMWMGKNLSFSTTDSGIPPELCCMINVPLDARNQSVKLCAVDGYDVYYYHVKIDDLIDKVLTGMSESLVSKLIIFFEAFISKLNKYDEGTVIGSLMTFAMNDYSVVCSRIPKNNYPALTMLKLLRWRNSNVLDHKLRVVRSRLNSPAKPGTDIALAYINYIRKMMDQVCGRINDELWILNFFEKLYSDFELHGVTEDKLASKTYEIVISRLLAEETACLIQINAQANATPAPAPPPPPPPPPPTAQPKPSSSNAAAVDDENNPKPSTSGAEDSTKLTDLLANAKNSVVDKVGDMVGKSVDGLTSKFGNLGNWF